MPPALYWLGQWWLLPRDLGDLIVCGLILYGLIALIGGTAAGCLWLLARDRWRRWQTRRQARRQARCAPAAGWRVIPH